MSQTNSGNPGSSGTVIDSENSGNPEQQIPNRSTRAQEMRDRIRKTGIKFLVQV